MLPCIEDSQGVKYYCWDGLNLLERYNLTTDTQRTFTHGPTPIAGIGDMVQLTESGGSYAFEYDHRGSVFNITDASQDIVQTYEHDAWGVPLASEGDVMVMLDTDITPELAAEGMAREIVRRLQMMRRSAGFDIADHIATCYQGDEYIRSVMADFTDYIKQETLSEQLVDGAPEEGAYTESFKLEGHELRVGVKKLN